MSPFPHPHIACNRRVAAHDIRSCGPCSGCGALSAGPQSHVGMESLWYFIGISVLLPYHALNHCRQRFCWHGILFHKLCAILKARLIFGSHPRQLLSGKKQYCGFWLHGARDGPQSHTSSTSRRNLHNPVTGGSRNHTTWTGKSYTKPKLALFYPAVRCSCAWYVMIFLFVCSFVFMKLLSNAYVMFVTAWHVTRIMVPRANTSAVNKSILHHATTSAWPRRAPCPQSFGSSANQESWCMKNYHHSFSSWHQSFNIYIKRYIYIYM